MQAALPEVPCPVPAERDSFRILKLQRQVGWERYETTCDSLGVAVRTAWVFGYLGREATLEAFLRADLDLVPGELHVSGATSTFTDVDVEVMVTDGIARVIERRRPREVPVPEEYFTITHYPPMALEEALLRAWVRRGRPPSLAVLPEGEVRIEPRGSDEIPVAGRAVRLERYAVDGLVWGRQTVWLDEEGRLVASVSGDAELDRMEIIRFGYEAGLPLFVRRAVEDGLEDLARIAARISPVEEGAYAIVGARLVDGTERPAVEDAVLVLEDGRVTDVGRRDEVAVPDALPVFEANGMTALPGLWDMHGHYEQVEWLAVGLAAGVTTVRDVANEFELVTALRDAVREGRALGPRMLLAGVIDGGPEPLGVVTAYTPEAARAVVERYHQAGFDQIKIYHTLPPALVPVVVEEAHRRGMEVTGHVPVGMDAFEFVEAGADGIEHLGFVAAVMRPGGPGASSPPVDLESDAARRAIRFFAERGTVVDPSLARSEEFSHSREAGYVSVEPGVAYAPPALRRALESTGAEGEAADRAAESFRRSLSIVDALHEAGVPIVLGSDLTVPGHSIHRELELAVEAGLTPMEAIRAATAVPARTVGLDYESGTLEPGKRADLILVAGDPLREISDIRTVRYVVTAGRLFETAPLWEAAGFGVPETDRPGPSR